MASIKRSKNLVKINNSNKKLNNINKNSSNQSENTNSKDDNNSNFIEKSFLADLLKCEICNNLFDLNIHIPMVAKCGHTFCKKCILEKNYSKQNEACPLDNMQNIFNIESCIVNLRVELLIKKIFNISSITINTQSTQQNLNQKQIVYSKPDIKKSRTATNNNNNFNLNSHSPLNKRNHDYGYKKIGINNPNNSNKKMVKKNSELNDGLTSPQIEDEININNENKFLFEDEKINGVMINETIDTIPIYDEKSFCNVSFKEDVNELFAKNNILSNKKQIYNENPKKEINKNKNTNNTNTKKKNKKKKNESESQKVHLAKPINNFSLTPNKNKENEILPNIEIDNNNNINTDREYNINNKKIVFLDNLKDSIEKENDDMTKYKNNTHQVGTIYDKIQLQLNNDYDYFMDNKNINENIMKNNDDIINNKNIIEINKSKNKDKDKDISKIKKNLYISTQYFPPKKMILFSNSTTRSANIRLSTNPNNDNNDNKLNKNLILNKNANILSTQILKKSNNNTIETKNDVNFEELIKSSNKKTTRNERYNNYNSSDNENDLLVKNRTYNSKKNSSINDSIFGNIMNHSNNEYQNKNNDLNKNIKVLNRSNNNSSSFSKSNSNSAGNNKKKQDDPDDDAQKNNKENKDIKQIISVTQQESNNIFKKLNKSSKSQLLFFYDNSNKNLKDLKENENKDAKVKSFIEKRKNNYIIR